MENGASLADIYSPVSHLCDKGTNHCYIEFYDRWLAPYRTSQPSTIIEIGVARGGSILMWSRYFRHPDSKIVGVDILDCSRAVAELTTDPRITLVHGDSNHPRVLDSLPPADVIIDDGGHGLREQSFTFSALYPALRPGGLYIIEDIQTDACREALLRLHRFETFDLRHRKNRYDDVLMVARKT